MTTDTEQPPRTFITKLELENYRQFKQVALTFDPALTVLVAPNGGGKTALLDGVATALRFFVDCLIGSKASHGFDKTDMRRERTATGAMVAQAPTRLSAEGIIAGDRVDWRRELASADGRTTFKEASALATSAKLLLGALQDYSAGRRTTPPELPLIAYYGTGRLWSTPRLSEARKKGASNLDQQVRAYQDCLSPASNYGHFVLWFERVYREAQDERETGVRSPHRPNSLLQAVRTAADTVLKPTGWRGLSWSFISEEIIALHPEAGLLPVSLLSDGIRNMIALIADLAHRAVRLNPHLGEQAAAKTPGIVLIDELDMHLHPEWQQEVIWALTTAFPLVQFIVTTHSPQLISTVPNQCIRMVDRSGEISIPPQQTQGVESATLLAEVMGVDPVPPIKQARWVADYKAYIEQGQASSQEAQSLRQLILAHFGPQHPIVLDCDRLLRWQAFKLERSSTPGKP